jgi:arylsulfatase A-like enzyme
LPRRDINVLLIVIDTLRRDRMGVYGHLRNTTPRISKLAESSVVYERALSQAPWTTPSVASLLSSTYPTMLGIENHRSVLPESADLLPEVLREAGFATGAVVSHSFCSSEWGFSQGFDHFDESNVQGHDAVTSADVTDRATDFLERQAENEPWFLFVHYFDPHVAYVHHAEFSFGGPEPGYDGPIFSGILMRKLRALRPQLRPADVREITRLYDSEIAFTDAQVGRLLDRLYERGKFESTLIVLTADHGEEFLEHGQLGHTQTLYGELIGVPLIIHYPGVAASRVHPHVGLVDVYPTITAFLGIEAPASVLGTSLYDSRTAAHRAPDAVFSETSRRSRLRAAVADGYKLILDLDTGQRALYDLESDPGETVDIAGRAPQRVAALSERLDAWMESSEAARSSAPELTLTPEQEEHLKQLGYL